MLYTTEYPYYVNTVGNDTTKAHIYETDNIKFIVYSLSSNINILALLRYQTEYSIVNFMGVIEYEFKTQKVIPKALHYYNRVTYSWEKVSIYGFNDTTNEYELLGESVPVVGGQGGSWKHDIILDTEKSYNKFKITGVSPTYCILDYEPATGQMVKNKVQNAIMQNKLLQKLTIAYDSE